MESFIIGVAVGIIGSYISKLYKKRKDKTKIN